MSDELALTEQPVMDLSLSRPPAEVLAQGKQAAEALMGVIRQKPKPVIINNKQYLEFEDWQMLGKFYGVAVKVISTKPFEMGDSGVIGFEATAQAVHVASGRVISQADSMCLNDESLWRDRPLHTLRSMAQTRACAKTLRNAFAWVAVLAGCAPTPAEEMPSSTGDKVTQQRTVTQPKRTTSTQAGSVGTISEPQRKRMYAIWKKAGWSDEEVKSGITELWGFESTTDITKDKYEAIVKWIEAGGEGAG